MIQKFRDLLKVSENLEKVDNKLNVLHEETNFLKKNFEDIKESVNRVFDTLGEVSRVHDRMLKAFTGDLKEISDIKEKFREELFNFKLLKNEMQKQITSKFAEELEKEVEQRKEELKLDTGNYIKAKESIEGFAKELGAVKEELRKWVDISSRVKAADFELVRFAAKLKGAESEKLELMQKVDTMERLVGKLRRSQN